MATPRLHFTPFQNSYKVIIKNLEELTIAQIQEFESFVQERKGIFDFSSYSFFIQKRVGFSEFTQLLKALEIDAICSEERVVRENIQRIPFGQYKGMSYSELPDAYLLWLSTNYKGHEQENISKELQKRNL
ncbi:MAG: DUF3820 family protein [Campylobacterales bacterium]|nr:DUF3820 family protein [Campylobacterales bacterium]